MRVEQWCAGSTLVRTLDISPLIVLAMWRSAHRLPVTVADENNIAGVIGQPGATPAFGQLCRHKPNPRSSPSLWGSPRAVKPGFASWKENKCGLISSR